MSQAIDDKLKDLATTDWQKFMEIAGPEFTFVVRARMLRKEGKSWQQISIVLEATPSQVRTACKDLAVKK